jgi:hypothetical protein
LVAHHQIRNAPHLAGLPKIRLLLIIGRKSGTGHDILPRMVESRLNMPGIGVRGCTTEHANVTVVPRRGRGI